MGQNQVSSVNIKHQNQESLRVLNILNKDFCTPLPPLKYHQASKSIVKIKCQIQASKLSIKIEHQNQSSKLSIKIKCQNWVSKSNIIKSLKHCFAAILNKAFCRKSEIKLFSSVFASWLLSVKHLFITNYCPRMGWIQEKKSSLDQESILADMGTSLLSFYVSLFIYFNFVSLSFFNAH